MATEIKGEPITFVFAGRRLLSNSKTGYVFYPVEDGKLVEKPHTYTTVKGKHIIGGIYTGARFDAAANVVYGLSLMRWSDTYKDKDKDRVAGWNGLDHEAMKEQAEIRAAAKYKPDAVEMMLPARRTMAALYRRGASHEAQAYRDMLIAELYRPLTKTEKEADE